KLRNYGLCSIDTAVTFQFSADFLDIFEVRGLKRKHRGRRLHTKIETNAVVLAYQGLDGAVRQTRLEFSPPPNQITGWQALFDVKLKQNEEIILYFTISSETDQSSLPWLNYDHAYENISKTLSHSAAKKCDIYTSNEQFNDWLNRSFADLRMMIT